MSPLTIVVSTFMVALVVMSLTFAGGAVPVALPLAAIVIGFSLWLDVRRQRRQTNTLAEERRRAKAHSVEFTERDKQTLYSD
jgi:lipopolysaccharide export LptBFGC system permease protein LptF